MKKLQIILLVLCFIFLVGCDSGDKETLVEVKEVEMTTLMLSAGYNLTQSGYSDQFSIVDDYLDVDLDHEYYVYNLYQGFASTEDEYIDLIVFYDTDIAEKFEQQLIIENENEDLLIYREEQVVVLTETQKVIDVFK